MLYVAMSIMYVGHFETGYQISFCDYENEIFKICYDCDQQLW